MKPLYLNWLVSQRPTVFNGLYTQMDKLTYHSKIKLDEVRKQVSEKLDALEIIDLEYICTH